MGAGEQANRFFADRHGSVSDRSLIQLQLIHVPKRTSDFALWSRAKALRDYVELYRQSHGIKAP
jgi:hypothetical protein